MMHLKSKQTTNKESDNQALLTAQEKPDRSSKDSFEFHDIDLPLPSDPYNTGRRHHKRSRLRDRVLRGVVAVFSLAAGAGLGAWYSSVISAPHLVSSLGIDTNTLAIPQHIFTNRKDVPFIPHPEYMGPSDEADGNWADLTVGSDTIYLPDPLRYSQTEPGIHAPFFIFNTPPPAAANLPNLNNFYVLNTPHQLHCVHMARKRYNMLVYHPNTTHPLSGTPIDQDWLTHIEHCFEYLRLSIMCADYMTLESDSPRGSPEEYTKDGLGWGVTHSCIDWEELMDFQRGMVGEYNRTWKEGS